MRNSPRKARRRGLEQIQDLALHFALLGTQPILDGGRIVRQNSLCQSDPAALVMPQASGKCRGFSMPGVKLKNAPRQGAKPPLQRVSHHVDSKSSPGDSLPQRILRIEPTDGESSFSLSLGTSITYKG